MKRKLTKLFSLFLVVALIVVIVPAVTATAATTADITVTATPSYVAISCNCSSIDFGTVVAGTTSNTSSGECTIDNTSSVQTDQTISVTTDTWSGGVTWAHSDTATPDEDQAGLKSNQDGTWGTGDIIIKYASPNYIKENQAANTDYDFGIGLVVPSSFTDGVEKTITVRVTAAEG